MPAAFERDVFTPPLASTATRPINKRSSTSVRTFLTIQVPADEGRSRRMELESKGEADCLFLTLATGQVFDVRKQVGPITYQSWDGQWHDHTFDLLFTMMDGTQVAKAVKPFERVVAKRFDRELAYIARAAVPTFCAKVVLFTDRDYKQAAAKDARRQYYARHCPDERRRAEGLPGFYIYSERQIQRMIADLSLFERACAQEGVNKARHMFSSYLSGVSPVCLLERIEIDDWEVDLVTWLRLLGVTEMLSAEIVEKLPLGRRWICVAIDVASRCILGLRIAAAPSAEEFGILLEMVVSDKSDLARACGAQGTWASVWSSDDHNHRYRLQLYRKRVSGAGKRFGYRHGIRPGEMRRIARHR